MPAPDRVDWRERLGALGPGAGGTGTSGGAPASPADDSGPRTPLALLFQLRRITRQGSTWTAPRGETATGTEGGGDRRLAVRPAVRSARGNWVTSAVGWGSLGFTVRRLRLDPVEVRWFSQLAALHRAGTDGYRAHEPDWLYLDDLTGPLLWPLLEEAGALGIPFVTGTRDGGRRAGVHDDLAPVRRTAGTVRAEVRAAEAGALEVRTLLTADGSEIVPTGPLGDRGAYLWDPAGPTATLVELSTAAAEALRSAPAGEPFSVPAADRDEFLASWYPRLARRVEVTGVGLDLPELREETVLVVEHGARDSIVTRWEARFGELAEPRSDGPVPVPPLLRGVDAAVFAAETLPALEARGIRVIQTGRRPAYRRRTETPKLQLTAVPSEKRDWLDLGFLVTVGEAQVPLAKLFTALSRGRTKLLLVDKSYLDLDQPVFDELRELIEEASELEEWETAPRLSRYRATLLEPFEDLADQQPEAVAWRATAAALRTTPPPRPAPDGLRAELRPYQLDGFRWLAHLWEHGLGGVLADDMGLGKTLQAIALQVHARHRDPAAPPHLVVAPTSVLGNWRDEIARFAPGLRVAVLDRVGARLPAGVDVAVTSYAVLRLDAARMRRRDWSVVWLDEAQYVKNPAAQVHEAAAGLGAPVLYALTGTPLENSLLDLWALFRLAAPGLFPSRVRFADRYLKVASAERLAELRSRIRPLLLRRTKEAVAPELPPRSEQTLAVDLAPEHRALYDRVLQRERQKLLGLVDDLDRNRFIVFRSLTLLRLLALDARLVDEDYGDVPASKLDALVDQLLEARAEGHRALVFSQFTGYLGLVRDRLAAEGVAAEYLDGATRRRDDVIRRFRAGQAPVFLISLRAGGVGLTLTEADYVFLLDPWWNPATEQQAVDRAHRIGQDRPVVVYRLVARDTIEEKVVALSAEKRALFDRVVDDGELFAAPLTADDVRALLA